MKELLLVLALGQSVDVTTSLMAFHRGAHEANPFVISDKPAPFIAEAVIFTGVEVVVLNKLSKHHPKLAKTLGYVQIWSSVAASVQNARVYRRLK